MTEVKEKGIIIDSERREERNAGQSKVARNGKMEEKERKKLKDGNERT